MKIVIDRRLCDTTLTYCQRCSAALIRHPEGYDRMCILDVVNDDSDLLTIEMFTDGRRLEIQLTEEEQELAAVEGWEALADFDPALFRSGAMERWQIIGRLPAQHSIPSEKISR
ncbi:MAG: hypothetical protein GY796_16245 [Chloroflexi bacterium]|nr:hypothetical protein [Chloroflexota bacterium]